MFDFLKKKKTENNKKTNLYAVATGTVVPITEVTDPVFSQKMMGDGFAVIPNNGDIYTPVEGTISTIFKTKHAVGFQLDNGLEILLHMGIDTVELNGEPFEIQVSEGAKVTKGTLLAKVDLAKLEAAGKSTEMIVVVTNMDLVKELELLDKNNIEASEEIGFVEVN